MSELFRDRPLKVVESLKKEIINQVKAIKIYDEDFDCDGVEIIQSNINEYLDIINGIYQDLLIEYIDRDTKIVVVQNSLGELGYDKESEDNE